MADSDTPAAGTGEQAGPGATGDVAAGDPLPLAGQPATGSCAREPCEKDDDLMVKNPQVMEDYRKAVEKKKKEQEQAAAEGGHQSDRSGRTSGDEVEGKAPAKP